MVIKLSEKESFLKSFLLFFLTIEVFLIFIFYNYYYIEERHIKRELVLEMKNYSLFFEDERFSMNVSSLKKNDNLFYELYFNQKNIYILVPMPESREDALKVIYPRELYQSELYTIKGLLLKQFLLLSLIALLISTLFSFYVLKPLRYALKFLEIFIKDIIHDLNTPLTTILINLKMMNKDSSEVQTIIGCTKTISMLHENLDTFLKEVTFEKEKFYLKDILDEQIDFFYSMYDYLDWDINIRKMIVRSDKNTFSRIIYNLLSNACKYNTSDGYVKIKMDKNILSISNNSHHGITNPSKVFERFYKENDRGLGIGLHIVDKLCDELNITKKIETKDKIVSVHLNLNKIITSP